MVGTVGPFTSDACRSWLSQSIVGFGLLFIVLLWTGIAYQVAQDREHALGHARATVTNLTRAFEEHVVRTLKGIDQSLLDLVAHFEADPHAFDIAAAAARNRFLEGLTPQIGIIDARGLLSHTTVSSGLGVELSDRDHFRVHREDNVGLFISRPVLGRASGKWSIQFTRPIRHEGGEFAGVVVVSIDPSYFSQFYNSVDIGGGGVVVLTGLDGFIRARAARDDPAIGSSVANGHVFQAALRSPAGVVLAPSVIDGARRLFAYRVLEQFPLVVIVGLAEADILQDQKTNLWRYAVAGAVVTALILLACGLLAIQVRRQQQTEETLRAREVELAAERTKLRAVHRALQEESAAVIRSSPVGICALDRAGRVTTWNPAMERLSGYTADEVLGRGPPLPGIATTASGGAAAPRVVAHHRTAAKNGQPVDISVTTAPLTDTDDAPRGAIIVVEDVTQQRAIEERLRESEERLRGIAANLPGVLYQRVSRRDGSYAYTFVSERAAELSGYTAEEWYADPARIRGAVAPESLPHFDAALRSSAHTMTQGTVDLEFVTRSGDRRWWRSMFRPRRSVDGNVLWDGLVFDITELRRAEEHRRELEAQVRHALKMEALGTLASGVAHDINNALVPIVALTKLLLDTPPQESPRREALQVVRDAAYRARDLVAQVLAFGRKEAPRVQRIRLQDAVERAVRLLRATLPPNVSLVAHVPPETAAIDADENQLVQVLMNLCTNAAQAIGARTGRIALSVADVLLDARSGTLPPGRYARLVVADDGCGMDSRTLERIFEPFFTTKAVGEGTGLGLSVVHGIVGNHSGGIAVESEPGRGTVFTILLPLADQGETSSADVAGAEFLRAG